MTYEKLNDTLDKKMLDFNLKILGLAASLLFRPLALASEPFFRKNMGERYFTGTTAAIAAVL
jgi:DMSO/TMAO reductase YedYZ heme-binding membrane subunit